MSTLRIAAAILLFAAFSYAANMKDSQGNSYPTVKIGNQVWMAANMNAKTKGSFCYDEDKGNCQKYGRLYTIEAAQKVCPTGWDLPTVNDYTKLLLSTHFELEDFNVSLGGLGVSIGETNRFSKLEKSAGFWSSNILNNEVYALQVNKPQNSSSKISITSGSKSEKALLSVRCVQKSKAGTSTTKKVENGTYTSVRIGSHEWMRKNMSTKIDGSICFGGDEDFCKDYGRLYTWDAAQQVCPAGWHLPSKEEFNELLYVAGDKDEEDRSWILRSKSWDNGSDLFGLSLSPTGLRIEGTSVYTNAGLFWSTSRYNSILFINPSSGFVDSRSSISSDSYMAVRCVKDENMDQATSQSQELTSIRNLLKAVLAKTERVQEESRAIDYEIREKRTELKNLNRLARLYRQSPQKKTPKNNPKVEKQIENKPNRISIKEPENTNQIDESKLEYDEKPKAENENKSNFSIKKGFLNLAFGLGYHGLNYGWNGESTESGTGVAKDFLLKVGYPISEKLILHGALLEEWGNITFSMGNFEIDYNISTTILGVGASYYLTENWNISGSIGYGKLGLVSESMKGIAAQASVGYDYWIHSNMAIGGSCSLQFARAEKENMLGTLKSISFLFTVTFLKNPGSHD